MFRKKVSIFLVLMLVGCQSEKDPCEQGSVGTGSLGVSGLTSSSSDRPVFESDSVTFNHFFKPVRTVYLSEDVLVGDVSSLDVNSEGGLLITDLRGNQVLLFDKTGRYLKTLSVEACHPGFNWNPIRAKFKPDGSIQITNNGPWGYRFSRDGDCVGGMDDGFRLPFHFDFDGEGNIYGFYRRPDGYFIKKMNPMGRETSTFAQDGRFKNFVVRMRVGGLAHDRQGFVYLALPHSPYVYKYDEHGNCLGALGQKPAYFRSLAEDIGDFTGNTGKIAEALFDKLEEISITLHLFLLDKDKLLIMYENQYKYRQKPDEEIGIVVMDLEGHSLMTIEMDKRAWFLLAKEGYVYRVVQPPPDQQGNVPNPALEVSQFIPAETY